MSLSTLALALPLVAPFQEPFPPGRPLFPMHGLGVHAVAHARAADLDGDGHLDVVTTGDGAYDPLRVHLGDGRGALFRDAWPPLDFPSGGLIRGMALGDFDGDGDPEPVVLADSSTGAGSRFFVFDNDGSGAMTLRETIVYFSHCDRLATADFDANGSDDLVFTRAPQNSLLVIRSLGASGFAPPMVLPLPDGYSGPSRYVIGDTSGDGLPDVVSLHGSSTKAVFQYLSDGGTAFHAPVGVEGISPTSDALSLADLRGDGVLHLGTSGFSWTAGHGFAWFENDGTGRFHYRQRLDDVHIAYSTSPLSEVVDLDGDGRDEWLLTRYGFGLQRVVARGEFVEPTEDVPSPVDGMWLMEAADFDSDGAQDLLVIDASVFYGTLTLARGDGAGRLAGVVRSPGAGAGGRTKIVDLDGDPHADLVVITPYPPGLTAYRGLGNGSFANPQTVALEEYPYQVVTGDFDGNGRTDLGVVEGQHRSVELVLQAPDGSFASAGDTPPTQVRRLGHLHAISLDSDGDGRDELAHLDPHAQRLFLIGLDDAVRTTTLGELDLSGTRALHGVVEASTGQPEGLELIGSGSVTHLSLWHLRHPLSTGASQLAERLALPVDAPPDLDSAFLGPEVRVEDIDGDRQLDVWTTYVLIELFSPFRCLSSTWAGLTDGSFDSADAERSFFIAEPRWTSDLDGDGVPELGFMVNTEGFGPPFLLQVQRGRGGTPFGDPETYAAYEPALGDVDGDGLPDLVVSTASGVHALLNQSRD